MDLPNLNRPPERDDNAHILYDLYCECCPHNEHNTLHSSTENTISKLYNLILDDEGCILWERQMILFNHYFGLTKGILRISDVRFIPVIMEFLCQNLRKFSPYVTTLLNFFYICRNCPVITKPSELLINYTEDLQCYFSCLGNCLALLDGMLDFQFLVLNIIENLCSCEEEGVGKISFEIRKESLGQSDLPEQLMDFLIIAPEELCDKTLHIIHQITVYSVRSSQKLLRKDFVNQLILFKSNSRSYRISDIQRKQLIINILWHLLECEDKQVIATLNPLPKVVLRTLVSWLRCEVLYGSSSTRNDILALICRILFSYEKLEIGQSGILEDLFLLCVITEFNIQDTWASNVIFKATTEDVQFKKILLIILAFMLKSSNFTRLIASEYSIIPNLAVFLDPTYKCLKTNWSINQKWDLLIYVVNVLPFFASEFPNEYIISGITGRLFFLLEYFSIKVERTEIVCAIAKTLLSLILKKIVPIEHYRNLTAFELIIRLTKSFLFKPMMTIRQVLLTYLFWIISELCSDYFIDPRFYPDLIIITKITLRRILTPDKQDYKIDESLVISAGSFIWTYVVNDIKIRRLFIQKGMIYIILDLIEASSFPIQLLYTGLLADLAEDIYSVVPLVTWRGSSENDTILSLLCSLWRTQEKLKDVNRGENGCAVDMEQIFKGRKQKRVNPDIVNSPPILEIYGCIRPKIYALVTFLLRDHFDAALKAVEVYGIQLMNLNVQDKLTLKLIQYYEHIKRGEVWENMLNVIKGAEGSALPVFVTYLDLLVNKYFTWGIDILQDQYSLISDDARKAMNEEEALYAKLKSCLKEREMLKLHNIQYSLCTSDVNALNLYKKTYIKLLEEQRKQQISKNDKVHLTHNLNVYVNLGKTARNPIINSITETKYLKGGGNLQKDDKEC